MGYIRNNRGVYAHVVSKLEMNKYYKMLFLLLISALLSCKQERIKEIQISDEFRLEFLNSVLSDTINLRLISNKEQLITTGSLIPGMMPLHPGGGKTISHSKFISDILEIYDTTFVQKQFRENEEFDFMQIEKYAFRVFDLEELKNSLGSTDIYDTVAKMNVGYNSFYRTIITKPIFNKEKNKAYLMINNFGGKTYILEKVGENWRINSTLHHYVG